MLAIVMAIVSFASCFNSFAVTYPYVERDDASGEVIAYHRMSNNTDLAFNVNYDEMVEFVREQLINHAESIDYYFAFAPTDMNDEFIYEYSSEDDKPAAQAVANALYDKLICDVFEIDSTSVPTVGGGEYLFNSISTIEESSVRIFDIGHVNTIFYPSWGDEPQGNEQRYYPFRITIENIEYYTTTEQEEMTNAFAKWFKTKYLSDNMSPYDKVKTIYDFIVRNTTYDWDVYRRNNEGSTVAITDERYNIAHSAYGALFGNILDRYDNEYIKNNFASLYISKTTVTNERVPVTADRGMAVCEGYSKLFYYLCTYNGIRARIVDGDYTEGSGKPSDPHEWNFVFLDDESDDGWKWFQVDCTRAAQNSVKQININNYNYFLGGYESVYFGTKNHQQAYDDKGAGIKPQLYDWWYDAANKSSQEDYVFEKVSISTNDILSQGYIVRRSTHYSGETEETVAYIYCDRYGTNKIEITEEGIVLEETDGFVYTGYESKFSVIVPYIVNRINVLDDGNVSEGEYTTPIDNIINTQTGVTSATVKETGTYVMTIIGAEGTSLDINFEIVPRNMSKDYISNDCIVYNPEHANYTGNPIVPTITVTDPKANKLVQGRDYTVSYYLNGASVSEIKNIGSYTINIDFKGNYRGTYPIDFTVGKIDLSSLSYKPTPFQYMPKYYREQYGYDTPLDYYKTGITNGLTVGALTIKLGTDFTATATGDLEYGTNRGTITLKGKSGNESRVEANSSLTVSYDVTNKFNITSYFDGKVADNTGNIVYTGSAVKPARLEWLDTRLVRGKDYEITGYKNNNAAGIGTVYIKGIGGCTGEATMTFLISAPNYTKPTANSQIYLKTTKYTYDGSYKKPTVVFKNNEGKTVNTYYYTVSYSGNKNPGKAYATVNLRNGYSGSFKFAFTINPKGTSLSSLTAVSKGFTAKWKKQATQTTGYQLQYSTSSKFSSPKTVTVSKNSTVSKKITKLKSKKKYYVRVRTYKTVSGKKYYSSWSKALTVTTKK